MASCFHKLERIDPQENRGYRYHCTVCDRFLKIHSGVIVRNEVGPVRLVRDSSFGRVVIILARFVILEWLDEVYASGFMTLATRHDLCRLISNVRKEARR